MTTHPTPEVLATALPLPIAFLDAHRTVVAMTSATRLELGETVASAQGRAFDALLDGEPSNVKRFLDACARCDANGMADAIVVLRQGQDDVPTRLRMAKADAGYMVTVESLARPDSALRGSIVEAERWKAVSTEATVGIAIIDAEGRIVECNWRFVELANPVAKGWTTRNERAIVGQRLEELSRSDWPPALLAALASSDPERRCFRGDMSRGLQHLELELRPLFAPAIGSVGCSLIITDRSVEQQLRQSQKLEAIGQLAAGVAHEINTPTQYVRDNVEFVASACRDFVPILERVRALTERVDACDDIDRARILGDLRALSSLVAEVDLDYVMAEVPRALAEAEEGLGHITRIVSAMKEFSHPASTEREWANVNRCIETTVTVARGEWKGHATVELGLDETLGDMLCFPAELNQALLNLIVNAAHAIREAGEQRVGLGASGPGIISIRTMREPDAVVVSVEDTGTGMTDEVRERIFDPFFTTKAVGVGTGQGLAFVWDTIVNKHGGTIGVSSVVGEGSKFVLRLPVVEA